MTKVIVASRKFANAPKNLKPEMYGYYSRTPLIRKMVFLRINIYPDGIDWWVKFVVNSTKLTYLNPLNTELNPICQ